MMIISMHWKTSRGGLEVEQWTDNSLLSASVVQIPLGAWSRRRYLQYNNSLYIFVRWFVRVQALTNNVNSTIGLAGTAILKMKSASIVKDTTCNLIVPSSTWYFK